MCFKDVRKILAEQVFGGCIYGKQKPVQSKILQQELFIPIGFWGIPLHCDLFRKRRDQKNFLYGHSSMNYIYCLMVCEFLLWIPQYSRKVLTKVEKNSKAAAKYYALQESAQIKMKLQNWNEIQINEVLIFLSILVTGILLHWGKNVNHNPILDHFWIVNIWKETLRLKTRYLKKKILKAKLLFVSNYTTMFFVWSSLVLK